QRAALEILVIRGRIDRGASGRQFADAELELQLFADMARDVVLQHEHAFQFAVVAVGPYMKAVGDPDQLRGDAHLLALAPHAALDDMRNAELAPDLAHVAALA